MDFEIINLRGAEVTDKFGPLADLRIKVFREFPYLYDGSIEYERNYLKVYARSERALVVVALYEGEVVGASTAIPAVDAGEEFVKAISDFGYDIDRVFYFGESLVYPEYRGQGLGHQFFELREKHAKEEMPDLEQTMFCAVDRPLNHSLRPSEYKPLDKFWERMGYKKIEEFKVHFPWKDLDQRVETKKPLTFWVKNW